MEAEESIEEYDEGHQDFEARLSELEHEREIKERRRQFRLVKSA